MLFEPHHTARLTKTINRVNVEHSMNSNAEEISLELRSLQFLSQFTQVKTSVSYVYAKSINSAKQRKKVALRPVV